MEMDVKLLRKRFWGDRWDPVECHEMFRRHPVWFTLQGLGYGCAYKLSLVAGKDLTCEIWRELAGTPKRETSQGSRDL